MTTQPPDLKKLREVAANLPDEASVNVHIAKIDELIGPLSYCSFEQAHAWAVLKFQISQLFAANPSALLDAYEASARDAAILKGGIFLSGPNAECIVFGKAHVEPAIAAMCMVTGDDNEDYTATTLDAARHATQGD